MVLGVRKRSSIALQLLALFLLGTIVFLTVVRAYFRIDGSAYIKASELGTWSEIRAGVARPSVLADRPAVGGPGLRAVPPDALPDEKIPRIIHQTWKTDDLPSKWIAPREACKKLHPT